MSTNLDLLTTAAGKWEAMAGELGKVETRYGDSVQKITMGNTWNGVSSGTAQSGFAGTRYEYSAAQIQAKAIGSLLRDAHEKFTDLKHKVESARADAIAAGMTVSEQGHVAFDWDKLTASERSAYHHDPDGEASIRTAVTKWQQHIDDRVKAVSELDQNVKLALEASVVDSNKDALGKGADMSLTGFNAGAEGDLTKAVKAAQEAKKAEADAPDGKKDDDGLKITGPDAGFKLTGVKNGKEGSFKLYGDLFHLSQAGEATKGGVKFTDVYDVYGGARATGNYGFSNSGASVKLEASAGIRELVGGTAEYGPVKGYARTEVFAGAEGSAGASLGKDGFNGKFQAFAGAKASVAGGGEVAGIGAGATAEGWYGAAGAELKWDFGKGDDGKYHFGGKVGGALGIGGAVGGEFTVDPGKVSDAFGDAADAIGDTAGSVKHTVGGWFD
ncbi:MULTISPECIES: hypothetical protein [unclassified Streptomyces]|uniref:hypothetical protein n=1 Tax=unclassified Streptomyces TaxID=2593676 RepID=UPI002E31F76A|nr:MULTISPECIES: hypothetical protein [unclassified Streptomyces]WUC66884.1 hypothetical protein OG861_23140 [Streptomyces sp. NBC_00539]